MGGAGVYIAHIAPGLAALGHEVHVITAGDTSAYTHCEENGVQVHHLPLIKRVGPAISYWFNLPRYFGRINRKADGFDLIHNNNLSDLTLPHRLAPQPRLMTVHHLCATTVRLLRPTWRERLAQPGGELGFGPTWERICIRRADALVAVSENTAADLIATYKVDPARISVVSHGARPQDYSFEPQDLAEIRAKYGATDGPMLLAVGRLEQRKGIEILLKAFVLLMAKASDVGAGPRACPGGNSPKIVPGQEDRHGGLPLQLFSSPVVAQRAMITQNDKEEWALASKLDAYTNSADNPTGAECEARVRPRLVIVGSGDQQAYRDMSSALGIDGSVMFAGRVDDLTLRKLYAACDLFVFPSLMEGLGIVALEARAAGKYVVGSRTGGIPEVVPPGAGALVPPGDHAALAHALAHALSQPGLKNNVPVPSWGAAVRKLHDCYERTAQPARRHSAALEEI